jgi:hypothetical protein
MRKLLVGFSALGVLFYAAPAFAGIALSATGNVPPTLTGLVTPPANVVADTSLTYQIWNEQLSTLTSPVSVDNNGAVGSYSGLSPGTGTTLATGTPFGTTYIQLSPGVDGLVHSGEATILFSSKIIGLALSSTNLQNTNIYGAAGTTYPSPNAGGANNNGGSIVGKTNQFFTITDGGRELEVALTANFDGFKDIRVFTAGNSSFVPEPASLIVWSVLGTVITGGAFWRRQRLAV